MIKRKLLISLFLAIAILSLSHKSVRATEGTTEINSTTGSNSRCFATSVYLGDAQYHLLITCRNLIYPPEAKVLYYLAWATSTDNNIVKLGTLYSGKLEAKIKVDFNNLFITKETSQETKQPTGQVVMQGNVQPISFLEKTSQPEKPVETVTKASTTETTVKIPTVKQNRLEAIFKGSLIIPIVAFFIIIFIILFLVRRRE